MIKNQRPVSKPEVKISNLVLVHDHISKSFQPRFNKDFRVVSIKGNTDVQKTTMAEEVKELLPNFNKFGRRGKLCMNLDLFED